MAHLKRDSLNLVETIALSAAVMAPSASMALNVSLVSALVGVSVTVVFLIAMAITFCISAAIIKFNQLYSTSGSLYKFTEYSLGRRVALVTGWALFLAYFTLVVGVSGALGAYVSSLLGMLGLRVSWLLISLLLSVLMWFLAYRDINLSTKVMLALEGVSIALILILAVVIFFKVGLRGLSLAPLGFGTNHFSAVAEGVVMALLCFAGFECSSSLGEEAKNPTKMIPLVIVGTIAGIAAFFLISSYSQVIGFGVTPAGVQALSTAAMPLIDLATKFVSKQYAFLIVFALTLSLFSCVIGCVCTGARILFAIGRDGFLPKQVADVHAQYKTPHVAVHVTMLASALLQVLFYIWTRGDGKDLYNYNAFVTALSMLVAYLLVNAAGIVYFYRTQVWRWHQFAFPVVGIVAMLYAVYSNIYPVPPYPMNLAPYVTVGFIVIMVLVSRLTRRLAPESHLLTNPQKR
ncbi:MAG: APC family permease [Alicyclobacillaceae bacterium]|nr:APC family permease [Alicyclobacillaceae bacterium]